MGLDMYIYAETLKTLKTTKTTKAKFPNMLKQDWKSLNVSTSWTFAYWRKEFELMDSFIEVFLREDNVDADDCIHHDLSAEILAKTKIYFVGAYIDKTIQKNPDDKPKWGSTRMGFSSDEEHLESLKEIAKELDALYAFMVDNKNKHMCFNFYTSW